MEALFFFHSRGHSDPPAALDRLSPHQLSNMGSETGRSVGGSSPLEAPRSFRRTYQEGSDRVSAASSGVSGGAESLSVGSVNSSVESMPRYGNHWSPAPRRGLPDAASDTLSGAAAGPVPMLAEERSEG